MEYKLIESEGPLPLAVLQLKEVHTYLTFNQYRKIKASDILITSCWRVTTHQLLRSYSVMSFILFEVFVIS